MKGCKNTSISTSHPVQVSVQPDAFNDLSLAVYKKYYKYQMKMGLEGELFFHMLKTA